MLPTTTAETELFGIRRSIRYHNRRRLFFDRFHAVTNIIAVLFGSAAIYTVLAQAGALYTVLAAALVSLTSTADLVIGTAQMARLHHDLIRRFIDLEKAVIRRPSLTDEEVRQVATQRLEIEQDEPPILRVLDSLCHNELLRAMGYGPECFVRVRWYQRLLANVCDINEQAITSGVGH